MISEEVEITSSGHAIAVVFRVVDVFNEVWAKDASFLVEQDEYHDLGFEGLLGHKFLSPIIEVSFQAPEAIIATIDGKICAEVCLVCPAAISRVKHSRINELVHGVGKILAAQNIFGVEVLT